MVVTMQSYCLVLQLGVPGTDWARGTGAEEREEVMVFRLLWNYRSHRPSFLGQNSAQALSDSQAVAD